MTSTLNEPTFWDLVAPAHLNELVLSWYLPVVQSAVFVVLLLLPVCVCILAAWHNIAIPQPRHQKDYLWSLGNVTAQVFQRLPRRELSLYLIFLSLGTLYVILNRLILWPDPEMFFLRHPAEGGLQRLSGDDLQFVVLFLNIWALVGGLLVATNCVQLGSVLFTTARLSSRPPRLRLLKVLENDANQRQFEAERAGYITPFGCSADPPSSESEDFVLLAFHVVQGNEWQVKAHGLVEKGNVAVAVSIKRGNRNWSEMSVNRPFSLKNKDHFRFSFGGVEYTYYVELVR